MVEAYWKIGRRIVEEEQSGKGRAEYGANLIKELSKNLGEEFEKGFSVANLKNFRQFFLVFPDLEKGYALRSELTWTHYRLIMRVENKKAREWYIDEAATQRWSTRQLERNIHSFYYERLLSSGKQTAVSPSSDRQIPDDFIKDPYVLEFLGIPEVADASEKQIETAIINHLKKFLLELGKGFSFVGRQFRISSERAHFYIDLVFYNYMLKCFVLLDLKTTKLEHQDIGQMDMYVRMGRSGAATPTARTSTCSWAASPGPSHTRANSTSICRCLISAAVCISVRVRRLGWGRLRFNCFK